MPVTTNINDAIWNALELKIKQLSWQCTNCPKAEECEEKLSREGFMPRNCLQLIKAAVYDENDFEIPFLQ